MKKAPTKEVLPVALDKETSTWLREIAQLHRDKPQNVAAAILRDVATDDKKAHD